MRDDELLEGLWRFMHLSVHRYNGSLTGEVLVVLTILLLDRANANPTISELADMTRLPKSNISRYVSNQLKIGHLTEQIDPEDRRRRILMPTEAGRKELKWVQTQISSMAADIRQGEESVPSLLVRLSKGMS
jgi:DNA-binding MarR family transcriptional regulator